MNVQKQARLASIVAVTVGFAMAAMADDASAQNYRLGTATEGGVWYILGSGFAQVGSEGTGAVITPIATAGALENVRRLSAGGDLHFAFVASTSFGAAIEDGTMDPSRICMLGAGHGNYTQVLVSGDSDIENWTQAFQPGRTIGVGEPGSAAFEMAEGAITGQGVSLDEVNAARLGHQAQSDAFKNQSLEVMVVSPGIPTAAVIDAISTAGAKLVSATDEEVAKTLEKLPYLAPATIPANTYDGQTEAVSTVAMPSLLAASVEVDDETTYQMTKSIFDNTERLTTVHSAGAEWTVDKALQSREFLDSIGIEYCPGAQKYYEEQGVW